MWIKVASEPFVVNIGPSQIQPTMDGKETALAAGWRFLGCQTSAAQRPLSRYIPVDWLKEKSTGNHVFLPLNMGVSCTFPTNPKMHLIGEKKTDFSTNLYRVWQAWWMLSRQVGGRWWQKFRQISWALHALIGSAKGQTVLRRQSMPYTPEAYQSYIIS